MSSTAGDSLVNFVKIRVRRAQSGDLNSVFTLAKQFKTGREEVSRDEFTVAFETIVREHEHEASVLFVAAGETQQTNGVVGIQILGYSLLSISRLLHAAGLTAHLHEIVVDEAARGMGVGEKLIRSIESYCAQRGVRQISASTARIGTFYNHLGFEVVGEHYRKVLDSW